MNLFRGYIPVFQEQFEMAVNHELAVKYNGMQLRDTTELNQATKVLNKH